MQSLDLATLEAALHGPQGASLRDTATHLFETHIHRGRRGLALCAPAYGAGVTFVTASLALALAGVGANILVIDANLHQPGMDALFPPAEGGAGVLQVLREEADLLSSVQPVPAAPNLSVLHAGGTDGDGAELFDQEIFERVMRDCQRSFDLTLVDSPPANRCAETRRIAAVTGYAAFVARRDRTYSTDLAALARDLRINRVHVLGAIFNEG